MAQELPELLAAKLLTVKAALRPDNVCVRYSGVGVALNLRVLESAPGEGKPMVLIEGDEQSLLFLADLLIAQASDELDCGFQITAPAPNFLHPSSQFGLYIHALPCAQETSSGDVESSAPQDREGH